MCGVVGEEALSVGTGDHDPHDNGAELEGQQLEPSLRELLSVGIKLKLSPRYQLCPLVHSLASLP